MTVLLETRNVSKSYGVFRALEQVTMAVHEGELVSVVGPNGAGKTTLVNLLTGLLDPTAGEVFFMGKSHLPTMVSRVHSNLSRSSRN